MLGFGELDLRSEDIGLSNSTYSKLSIDVIEMFLQNVDSFLFNLNLIAALKDIIVISSCSSANSLKSLLKLKISRVKTEASSFATLFKLTTSINRHGDLSSIAE